MINLSWGDIMPAEHTSCFVPEVPTTKRYLFHTLKSKLTDAMASGSFPSYTILGPRKVGKTIILKQLAEQFSYKSKYVDCSRLDRNTDFSELFRSYLADGVCIILLDEISKISEDCIADFVAAVKDFCWHTSFILTGSTKAAVSRLSNKIGRSDSTFELPPIMYVERLAWSSNVDVFDFEKYRRTITLESFENYVRHFALRPEESALTYAYSIVQDTMESILRHSYDDADGKSAIPSRDIDTDVLLKYISLCQLVYSFDGQPYCTIPSLSHRVRDIMGELYAIIKGRQHMSRIAVAQMCQLLLDSGLAVEMYIHHSDAIAQDTHLRYSRVDKDVPNIIFEYPWYASIAIADVLDTQEMWGFWVENLVYMKMRYAYRFVDKYRFGSDEIDIVYTSDFYKFYGLECKYRSSSNLRDADMRKYQNLARPAGLARMDITCTDANKTFDSYTHLFKVYELVAALELEYAKQVGDEHASGNLFQLMDKYFGEEV